jgi:hypothetical protein
MKTHSRCGVVVAGALLLLQLMSGANAVSIISDFEDGTVQGWSAVNFSAFQQQAPGGNPNGHLYIDNSEGDLAAIFAPAAFLGNLSGFNGGTFSFDGKMLGIGGSFYNNTGQDYGSVTITGAAGSATIDLLPGGATPSTDVWQTYSAALNAANWGKTELEWAAILANVVGIRIGVEALFGGEIQGIDNVKLVSVDSEVPLPGALPLFAGGLGVMGFLNWRRRSRAGAAPAAA